MMAKTRGYIFAFICLLLIVFFVGKVIADSHFDKYIDSKIIVGRFVQFQFQDYFHVSIVTSSDEEITFLLDDLWTACFLVTNSDSLITIKYDEVLRYFPEGRNYFPANLIRSMKTDHVVFDEDDKPSTDSMEWQTCLMLIDSYTNVDR